MQWISFHCGLQSTVVQSRVSDSSRGDLQIHTTVVFSVIDWDSSNWRISFSNCSIGIHYEELWWWTCVLTIPVKTSNRTSVATRECHTVTLISKLRSTVWCDDFCCSGTCISSLKNKKKIRNIQLKFISSFKCAFSIQMQYYVYT